MRQRSYLNVILTVNAVLLGGLLWTHIAGTPLLASPASAQNRSSFAKPAMIPNAAKQRDQITKAVRDLQGSVDSLKRAMDSGIKVQVTNFDEVK